MYDAEGMRNGEPCPSCGSSNTISYLFNEGFSELECHHCGYSSEQDDIAELTRYSGDLHEGELTNTVSPVPVKRIKA